MKSNKGHLLRAVTSFLKWCPRKLNRRHGIQEHERVHGILIDSWVSRETSFFKLKSDSHFSHDFRFNKLISRYFPFWIKGYNAPYVSACVQPPLSYVFVILPASISSNDGIWIQLICGTFGVTSLDELPSVVCAHPLLIVTLLSTVDEKQKRRKATVNFIACVTEEFKPLVKSACEPAPKCLFCAPTSVSGIEYAPWFLC